MGLNDPVSILRFVCRVLTPWEHHDHRMGLQVQMRTGEIDWERVVQMSSEYLVVTGLWSAFVHKGLVELLPGDVGDCLKELHRLNEQRNQRIKRQTGEIIGILNSIGVEPLLLKGIAYLFADLFLDTGSRIMADVDVLVPKDRLERSLAVIQSYGYEIIAPEPEKFATHQHVPPLAHPSHVAALEVHTSLLPKMEPQIVEIKRAWQASRRMTTAGLAYRVLSPDDGVLYNLIHSEVHHQGYNSGHIPVKGLFDFAHLILREGTDVNWQNIQSVMENHRLGGMLSSYLFMGNDLFSTPIPPELKPQRLSRRHSRRAFMQVRWKSLMLAGTLWGQFRRLYSPHRIRAMFGCEDSRISLARGWLQYSLYLIRTYVLGTKRAQLPELLFGRKDPSHNDE